MNYIDFLFFVLEDISLLGYSEIHLNKVHVCMYVAAATNTLVSAAVSKFGHGLTSGTK